MCGVKDLFRFQQKPPSVVFVLHKRRKMKTLTVRKYDKHTVLPENPDKRKTVVHIDTDGDRYVVESDDDNVNLRITFQIVIAPKHPHFPYF